MSNEGRPRKKNMRDNEKNLVREGAGAREKVVVDIISGLQAVSLHLMGQTSLLSHFPSLRLSLLLTLSLSPCTGPPRLAQASRI